MTGTASDWVVPLRGELSIMLIAGDHGNAGGPAYRCTDRAELVNVSGYSTFRQAACAGSYRDSTQHDLNGTA